MWWANLWSIKYKTCRKKDNDRIVCLRVNTAANPKNAVSRKSLLKINQIELIEARGYTLDGCNSKTICDGNFKF